MKSNIREHNVSEEQVTSEPEGTAIGANGIGAVVAAFSRLSHTVNSEYAPEKALKLAATTVADLLEVDGAAVILLDDKSNRLRIAAQHRFPARVAVTIKSIAGRSINAGTPLVVGDLSSHAPQSYPGLLKAGVSAFACAPMRVGERSVGALIVVNTGKRPFSVSETELLSTIANQAALAVWKSRSYSVALKDSAVAESLPADRMGLVELMNRKIRELSTLYRVSEAVVSTIDLAKLLKATLEQAMAAVGAGVGSIMLLDEETNRLTIRVSKGVPKEFVETASVALGEGISGWVALHGQGVLVHDPTNDSRFRLSEIRTSLTSAMSVPLKTHDKTVGVLNVSTVMPNRAFNEHDKELLSTLANQMASAIENARLYERLHQRSSQLSTLLGVARTISSTLDISEVLTLLADHLCGVGRADTCALLMFDEKANRFRLGHGRGLRKHRKTYSYVDLAQPIARRAVDSGKLEVEPEYPRDNRVAQSEGIVSGLALPLKVRGRVVAVASIFFRELRHYSGAEVDLLEALSEPAGIAVENARVYQHQYKIARLMQKHLTPSTLVAQGLEVGHKYIPAHDVGGDYYDFIDVGGDKTGLVVADVSGSSVSAAVYTSMGKHALRAYARDNPSPAEVLTKVNRIICEDTEPELFISMFYGVFDAGAGVFRYASGGHEPALLYRTKTAVFDTLHAPGILLGILPDSQFEEKEIALQPGDIIAVFTDGLTETSLNGKFFGVESVKESIASTALQPAQTIADNLYERLLQFADHRIIDDVGIVIVKAR